MKYARALARTVRRKLHLGLERDSRTGNDIDSDSRIALDQGPKISMHCREGRIGRQATLKSVADELSATEGVSLLDLDPLTTLLVRTRHSVYRMTVLQGAAIIVQGGWAFPDATAGHLNGSGFGGSLLKVGWVGVGLKMEICCDRRCFVTSPVEAITIESNPSTPQ